MNDSNDLRPYVLCAFGNGSGGSQRRAGDFQRNLCRWPKGVVNGYQCAPRRDVQCGCELQEIFPPLVTTPHENRNCERQPYPLAALYARLALIQTSAPIGGYGNVLLAPMGPNDSRIREKSPRTLARQCQNPRQSQYFQQNQLLPELS